MLMYTYIIAIYHIEIRRVAELRYPMLNNIAPRHRPQTHFCLRNWLDPNLGGTTCVMLLV